MRSLILIATLSLTGTAYAAEPPFPCGDLNTDGQVTASDAQRALTVAVGLWEASLDLADTDMDLRITVLDALNILRAAVGLPARMDCPEWWEIWVVNETAVSAMQFAVHGMPWLNATPHETGIDTPLCFDGGSMDTHTIILRDDGALGFGFLRLDPLPMPRPIFSCLTEPRWAGHEAEAEDIEAFYWPMDQEHPSSPDPFPVVQIVRLGTYP